ncbi:MAG: hypothetical protein WC438_02925 [Candidatus Pacearchaeota archaeon]
MLFRKMSSAERVGYYIGKHLAYAQKVRNKTDEQLNKIRDNYQNSRFRGLVKKLNVPILSEHYRFQEEAITREFESRDAVARYKRGEAVCGITGF